MTERVRRATVQVTVAMLAAAIVSVNGQTKWRQQEFVLSTYWDPPLDIRSKDLSKDVASFRLAKEAGFNLLTATQAEDRVDHSFPGMKHALRVAAAVGLRYLVQDNRMGVGYDKPLRDEEAKLAVKNYRSLPRELRDVQYGYDLCDEPHFRPEHLKNVHDWKRFLEVAEPGKLVFINLAPAYAVDHNWGGFSSGNGNGLSEEAERVEYEKYLRQYVDELKPQVVSFDNYPFFKDGSFRPDYFYNLEVIRRKSRNTPFWACPMTVDHYNYVDPQEVHLNFMYFCPIAYGAKGLTVFSFWPLPYDGFRSSLFDQEGNKTARYDIVRRLNMYVSEVVGPVVMRLSNIHVFHSSVFPGNQVGMKEAENRRTSLVDSVSDARVLIGIFKNSSEWYLFVVNKSLVTVRNIGVTLKGNAGVVSFAPRVVGFDETTSLEYRQMQTTVLLQKDRFTFVIPEMIGGEGRLIRVGN